MTSTLFTSAPPIAIYESSPFSSAAFVLGPKIPSMVRPASFWNAFNAAFVSLLSSLLISPEYKPRIVSWFWASDMFSTIIGSVVVVVGIKVVVVDVVDDEEVVVEVVEDVVVLEFSETVSNGSTDNKFKSFWEELL